MEDSPEQLCEQTSVEFGLETLDSQDKPLAVIQAERKQVEQDVLTIANRIKLLQAEE